MINKKTKNLGPVSAPLRKTPLVTKIIGGDTSGDRPRVGYHTVSSSIIESYTIGDKAAEFSGSGAALGSAYPVIGTNKLPSTGLNPYEPVKLAFIHKFGGPNMSSQGLGTTDESYWVTEEFLRVKYKKDKINNVYCPYNNAILTATVFPYGQTNTGSIDAAGNRTSVSLIRQRYRFVNTREYSDDDLGTGQLLTQTTPLKSSSINNLYLQASGISNTEFELSTNPSGIFHTYGVGGFPIDITKTHAVSIHPDLSNGDVSNYVGDPGEIKRILAGFHHFHGDVSDNNIQYVIQGATDGDDLSFITRAQKGCIIKGIIELF